MTETSTTIRHAKLMQEYPQGYVNHPGKFEGEPIAAVYFWELVLDGGGHDTLYDGDTPVDVFAVDADDRALWGLDDTTRFVAVYETESGFVMFHEWTEEEYQEATEACESEPVDEEEG